MLTGACAARKDALTLPRHGRSASCLAASDTVVGRGSMAGIKSLIALASSVMPPRANGDDDSPDDACHYAYFAERLHARRIIASTRANKNQSDNKKNNAVEFLRLVVLGCLLYYLNVLGSLRNESLSC